MENMETSEGNRVYCLYRVSTEKQVDHDANNEADIPMQRKACHKFAEQMGWEILHEEQEEGVSGHKVRAASRDKLQIIKEHALQKKFDILLVFMFDRIGRIADETPFVVEWFVKNGIRVWSTQEGEQRFDNHIDKLLNYIRFWQADGESEKTSIRTKTSLGQMVEDGHFKGGNPPYGYELVKSGRINKRKHELYDLKVIPEEAEVVKLIFDKYVSEGYGAQRISTFLNESGYRSRSEKMWHPASIRGIIRNPTYTGVLRSGESRSEILPELQIISEEQFGAARKICTSRADSAAASRTTPINTRGQSLLAGNVFCGHCGARLTLTTSKRFRKDPNPRIRYVCYGKTRKQTDCDGQTGYTMHILDNIVDKMVCRLFERIRTAPKEQLITNRYQTELRRRKKHLESVTGKLKKAVDNLETLQGEVIRCIRGESSFSQETLAGIMKSSEKEIKELEEARKNAQQDLDDGAEVYQAMQKQYAQLVSWAGIYNTASIEAKKMIVSSLFKRIEVRRDYELNVEMNISYQQFMLGLDCTRGA